MPFSYSTAQGTASLVGSSGMTMLINANADDSSVQIPGVTFTFFGVSRTVFVGSNSYITFGAGSSVYSSFSASNPGYSILIGASDNSYQRVYYKVGSLGEIVIRFEGTAGTSGTPGSPNIVWEVTLCPDGKIQLVVGTHARTAGTSFISNGTTATNYTLAQNQSYVFEPSGGSYNILTGYYAFPWMELELVATGGSVFGGSAPSKWAIGEANGSIVSSGGIVVDGIAPLKYDCEDTLIKAQKILKRSLLITHGTIYGTVAESGALVTYAHTHLDITDNMLLWGDTSYNWRDDLYNKIIDSGVRIGTVTELHDLKDFIHWDITGTMSPQLDFWDDCLTLLLRHI